MRRQPRRPLRRIAQPHDVEPQRLPVQAAAQNPGAVAELRAHVLDHAVVGRRGRRQHRHAFPEPGEEIADAPVVRSEVVPPIRDAVGLVDDDHARRPRQLRQHVVAELRIVQPLRRHQQHVDPAAGHAPLDVVPLRHVRAVDGFRLDARTPGRRDLVAHQRQQRRDDHAGPAPAPPQQLRRDEVHRRLAPAGALHHQHPLTTIDQPVDRPPLVVAQRRPRPRQPLQQLVGLRAGGGGTGLRGVISGPVLDLGLVLGLVFGRDHRLVRVLSGVHAPTKSRPPDSAVRTLLPTIRGLLYDVPASPPQRRSRADWCGADVVKQCREGRDGAVPQGEPGASGPEVICDAGHGGR